MDENQMNGENPYQGNAADQQQNVQNGSQQGGQSGYQQGTQNPYQPGGQNPYYQNNIPHNQQQPYYYNQNQYLPGAYKMDLEEPVSMLDWVGTILLLMVPCVSQIIYIVWAFSKDTKKSKANYCKAALLIQLILIGLYVLLFVFIFGNVFYYLS